MVLIVEGDPVHTHEAAWQGALGRALTLGASVLPAGRLLARGVTVRTARSYFSSGK